MRRDNFDINFASMFGVDRLYDLALPLLYTLDKAQAYRVANAWGPTSTPDIRHVGFVVHADEMRTGKKWLRVVYEDETKSNGINQIDFRTYSEDRSNPILFNSYESTQTEIERG